MSESAQTSTFYQSHCYVLFQISFSGEFPEPFVVVVSQKRIAVVDLESNYSKFVLKEFQNIKNLAIKPFEEKMYFMSGGIVYRANFDGSKKETIGGNNVRAFALDSMERRMYWVNDDGWIFRGNMNFSDGKYLGLWASGNNFGVDSYSRLVTHFLETRTLPETCMGQFKWHKNLLPLSNLLITLRVHVAMYRVSPKQHIISNFSCCSNCNAWALY